MEEGEAIPQTKGTVTQIYDRSAGENAHGGWSFQTIVLKDGPAEIKVKIKDRDPFPPAWKGKVIWLISHQDPKHGMTGLKIKLDTYQGKTTKLIWVTPTAEFMVHDGTREPGAPKDATPHPDPDPEGTAREQSKRLAYQDPGPTPEDDGNHYTPEELGKPSAEELAAAAVIEEGKRKRAAAAKAKADAETAANNAAIAAAEAKDLAARGLAPASPASPAAGAGEWAPIIHALRDITRLQALAARAVISNVVPVFKAAGYELSASDVKELSVSAFITWDRAFGSRVTIPSTPPPEKKA